MGQIASLLKPGGIFVLTTGNAEPHRDDLTSWSYVHPDIHIAYFEPRTLDALYRRCGLEPYDAGFVPGLDDVIRYKVLKTMGLRSQHTFERVVPWSVASRVVDRRHKVSAQPFARRPDPSAAAVPTPTRTTATTVRLRRRRRRHRRQGPAGDEGAVPRRAGAEGSRVLEVGCGGGKMLRTIAEHRPGVALFGCDVREPAAVDGFDVQPRRRLVIDPPVRRWVDGCDRDDRRPRARQGSRGGVGRGGDGCSHPAAGSWRSSRSRASRSAGTGCSAACSAPTSTSRRRSMCRRTATMTSPAVRAGVRCGDQGIRLPPARRADGRRPVRRAEVRSGATGVLELQPATTEE